MVWLAGFAVAVLVPVLLLGAIYSADGAPQPRLRIRRTMYFAMGTALLAVLASVTLLLHLFPAAEGDAQSAVSATWRILPILALTEEMSRFVVLLGYSLRPVEQRNLRYGILYGLTAGLTFALIENVMSYQGPGAQSDAAGWLRLLMATPLHTLLGGLMGYLLVQVRASQSGQAPRLILALLLPAAIHVAYDAPVLYAARLGVERMTMTIGLSAIAVSALIVLALAWTLWRLFHAAPAASRRP